MPVPPSAVATGLVIGAFWGFALQRGRFCMNSAFRDILLMKEYALLKAVVVALLVSMIGFHAMASIGVIQLNPKPLFWGANVVGGFIFGIGMVLAAGCASGTTYRVGEGMVGSFVALLGLMSAGLITQAGALSGVKTYLQTTTKITIADPGPLLVETSTSPTLANVLGVDPWILVAIISIVTIAILVWRRGKEEAKVEGTMYEKTFKRGWNWWVTGVLIGIAGILAFPASAAAGRNYPLGITGGWVDLLKALTTGSVDSLSWLTFLVIGVVLGAAIAAIIAQEAKLRAPPPGRILQQFLGGLIMGIGAVTQAGCNIGHILSGVPQLSLGSILGGAFIIIGCWVAAYLLLMRE